MLRLQRKGGPEDVSCLHDPKHSKSAYSLHSMGKKLSLHVWYYLPNCDWFANICSEIFGTSEDESPELDNSEDSENGKFALPQLAYLENDELTSLYSQRNSEPPSGSPGATESAPIDGNT